MKSMRWNQNWQSIARLETDSQILAEVAQSQGQWHVFMPDGRKSNPPHYNNKNSAISATERALQETGGKI